MSKLTRWQQFRVEKILARKKGYCIHDASQSEKSEIRQFTRAVLTDLQHLCQAKRINFDKLLIAAKEQAEADKESLWVPYKERNNG